jgi:hypothetical protein
VAGAAMPAQIERVYVPPIRELGYEMLEVLPP